MNTQNKSNDSQVLSEAFNFRDYIALNKMERIMSTLGFGRDSPGILEDTIPASAWRD
jgi:hypothetical protein